MVTKRRSQADGVFATTTELISYAGTWNTNDVVVTDGFTTVGDGGGAKWKRTGNTIAASQTPAQTGKATLSDANGNEFELIIIAGEVAKESLGVIPSSDNTAALQALINASSGKFSVNLGAGELLVSSIVLPSDINLYTAGGCKIKRIDGTGSHLLTATSKTNIKLSGFEIDGNKSATTGTVFNLLIDGCSSTSINDVYTHDSRSHDISIRNNINNTNKERTEVVSCKIKGSTGYGVEILDSTGVIISENYIQGTGDHGLFVYGSTALKTKNISITDNEVTECAKSGISCPAITVPSSLGVDNITVSDNNVHGNSENGIMVQAKNATVTGNVSSGNGTTISHQGILVNGENISITGNNSNSNTGVGIDLGDAISSLVGNNIVASNGLIGIEINSCQDALVDGNIVKNNMSNASSGIAANLKCGILIHAAAPFVGDSTNVIVSNNTVRAGTDQQQGIGSTVNASNVNIIDNDVKSAGLNKDVEIKTPTHEFTCHGNATSDAVSIASAATVNIEQNSRYQVVSGTTNINNIATSDGTYERGRELLLLFTGVLTVNDGGNLKLASNLVTAFGTTLKLAAENGDWYEVSRSSN